MYWYLEVLKKYAVFSGRARRTEYWMFQLVNFFIALAFLLLLVPVFPSGAGSDKPVGFAIWLVAFCVYILLTILPSLAVSVRRLHDADFSGWWLLLAFAPMGGLVIFVFHVLDGRIGPNRYGPDPKGRGPRMSPYTPYGTPAAANAPGGGAAFPYRRPLLGFCNICGAPMQVGTRFCSKCGGAAY